MSFGCAGALVSGRGALPAAGTFSDEKSGVSPGRNGGSGTCSASCGRVAAQGGSFSLIFREPLNPVSAARQLVSKVSFTLAS